MTITRDELDAHLQELLQPELFKDYAPNGLQIEGRDTIRRVVVGVSANRALIEAAIEHDADAVFVHHGFFWKNDPRTITGIRRRRIGGFVEHDISLFAYHLPLDAHAELGNNVEVLRALGANPTETFGDGSPPLGWLGTLPGPTPRGELVERIATATSRKPLAFLHGAEEVSTIGIVTGGGAGFFESAIESGAQLFVTGEPSEQSQGLAREWEGNFVAAGHHATERFGPRAVGGHLAERFGLEVHFVDVDNPV